MVPHFGHTGRTVVVVGLQASTPSNHLWSTFLLPAPPQFLNQAPPGAQQLTRPDFLKVPHFVHVMVLAIVEAMAGVLIGVRTISSRPGIERVDVHTVRDIDPDEPSNISVLLACECT